jgi:hypothetical protein
MTAGPSSRPGHCAPTQRCLLVVEATCRSDRDTDLTEAVVRIEAVAQLLSSALFLSGDSVTIALAIMAAIRMLDDVEHRLARVAASSSCGPRW